MIKQSRFRKPPMVSPLKVVMLAMLISASLRLGLTTNQALADSKPAILTDDAITFGKSTSPQGLDLILADVRAQELEIVQRREELRKEEDKLHKTKESMELLLQEIRQADAELRQLMFMADTAAQDDVLRLAKVYENMKPKAAAKLFEEMDPDFAAGFMSIMRADATAEIMAQLNPQTTYAISIVIAGRHAKKNLAMTKN